MSLIALPHSSQLANLFMVSLPPPTEDIYETMQQTVKDILKKEFQ